MVFLSCHNVLIECGFEDEEYCDELTAVDNS